MEAAECEMSGMVRTFPDMPIDPTARFSDRVENYLLYRPRYPEELLDILREETGLTSEHRIADIGSGTGFLAELFLKNGNRVDGVEPNREMREAGERFLASYPNFRSIDATAERTTLDNGSVDMITAGQAFHWFDADRAREEFRRILKPEGKVVLVWNNRKIGTTPFLEDYEHLLLTLVPDYRNVDHRAIVAGEAHDPERFFAPAGFRKRVVPNYTQLFDFDGLKGRLLSSSYAPNPGHPAHAPMIAALRRIFDQHQTNGQVAFIYDTEMYIGEVGR